MAWEGDPINSGGPNLLPAAGTASICSLHFGHQALKARFWAEGPRGQVGCLGFNGCGRKVRLQAPSASVEHRGLEQSSLAWTETGLLERLLLIGH